MNFKIVSDSSSDILQIDSIPFSSVPLKIITDEKEYIDDGNLLVEEMIEESASSGTPMSDEEMQYEWNRASHWATIGIGVTGYYQR